VLPQARDGIGAMGHVALNLDAPIEEAMETLRKHGIKFMGPVDRGYERSLYFKDPNGVLVELLTWITPLPAGVNEADVIARATTLKNADGSYAIEDRHVRQAMTELGFPPQD
jgi:glyoxalase family protein